MLVTPPRKSRLTLESTEMRIIRNVIIQPSIVFGVNPLILGGLHFLSIQSLTHKYIEWY